MPSTDQKGEPVPVASDEKRPVPDTAGERRVDVVILRLNTPGGLATSMREIIASAGLPLSSADRSAGEANWTAAAIAATRVARTITARLPNKTVYGRGLPVPQ
jgi:hypothetical protein